MSKNKIYSFYISIHGGTCIFSMNFAPMPPSALITAMISAMQSFIHEISGNQARKLTTYGFTFHIETVGKLSLILATSSDEAPPELTQLRNAFLHKFGDKIANFIGDTELFAPFEDDVRKVLNVKDLGVRTPPGKKMTAFDVMKIPPDLQNLAKNIAMNNEITVSQLSEKLKQTELQTQMQLDELFDMGYIGRYLEDNEFVYFM